MEQTNLLKEGKILEFIENGFPFLVSFKIEKRTWKFWKKPETTEIIETYKIKELSLSVMERIYFQKKSIPDSSNYYSPKNHKTFCKIIAMAVLGKDLEYAKKDIFGNFKFKVNKIELEKLTNIFHKNLSIDEVKSLMKLVDILHNHGDLLKCFKKIIGDEPKSKISIPKDSFCLN